MNKIKVISIVFATGIGLILLSALIYQNMNTVKTIEEIKPPTTNVTTPPVHYNYSKETYVVPTKDKASITFTRYVGVKRPSIILIHGMGCNHLIFDWDENHSLARFLAERGWDVWMLDLRTHDGDGDFLFSKSDGREKIKRYWDFDRTYLGIDVVTAVEYVKVKSGSNKIILSGHSYGGYLAYAYAEVINQNDLAGIITTSSSAMANPFSESNFNLHKYGFKIGKRAFIRPFGRPYAHLPKFIIDKVKEEPQPYLFYENTTQVSIQQNFLYKSDNEPAGVYVDMYFGKDPRFYGGHWVDPQTLYDYTANLKKITVPLLTIVGDKDLQDPKDDVFKTYQMVSSTHKKFLCYMGYAHMDILLGQNASTLIFPDITNWLDSIT